MARRILCCVYGDLLTYYLPVYYLSLFPFPLLGSFWFFGVVKRFPIYTNMTHVLIALICNVTVTSRLWRDVISTNIEAAKHENVGIRRNKLQRQYILHVNSRIHVSCEASYRSIYVHHGIQICFSEGLVLSVPQGLQNTRKMGHVAMQKAMRKGTRVFPF